MYDTEVQLADGFLAEFVAVTANTMKIYTIKFVSWPSHLQNW